MAASSNPFQRGSRGWGVFIHQNHGAGGENGSIMVGMFVCLCLVSKKPSEREFFVLAGTDLGVKLLNTATNQKQAAAKKGSMEGIWDEREVWGVCDSIFLVAIRCK